jgi:hypothetical protein
VAEQAKESMSSVFNNDLNIIFSVSWQGMSFG